MDTVTHQRLTGVESSINQVRTTVDTMAGQVSDIGRSLHILARLEERHAHTDVRLREGAQAMGEMRERISALERNLPDKLPERLHAIETKLPQLLETRKWIVNGILAVLGSVGVAVLALVVNRG